MRVGLRLAEEDYENEAETVDAGEEGAEKPGRPDRRVAGGPGLPENQVLAVETRCYPRQRGQCGAADQEAPERKRHLFAQATHLEDVLLVMQGQDHATG